MMKYRNAKMTQTGAIDAEILHPTLGWIPTTIEASDTGADYDVAALHGAIVTSGTAEAFVQPTATEISTEEAAQVRADRAARIAESDWTQLPDAPLTSAQKAAWVTYRQALRDVTKQATFPNNVTWPVTP